MRVKILEPVKPVELKRKRVCAYARVSTASEAQGESLENQTTHYTVAGGQWHPSTVLNILRNEKYKGDAKLQKTYRKDHLSKKKCINHGEVDSYYIEENHSPIVSRKIWEEAQRLMVQRAEGKGNVEDTKGKHQNRYPLTGMMLCSKCGAPLIRRTWNSKYDCKKIVWQCST